MSNDDSVLVVNNVSVVFDGFYALSEVALRVARNTIHFFIGPNGAGKTTLLDVICAKTKPTSGNVFFIPSGGQEIRLTGMKEHQIVNIGVARKFQVPSVFVNLSVLDNMTLSLKGHKGVLESIFFRLSAKDRELIDSTLDRVGLADRTDDAAGALAHGEKQWLEIAMQLVQKPELIMLDEPAAGMSRADAHRTGEIISSVKNECTIIIVEHDMDFVKEFSDMVTVLHEGRVLLEGTSDEALANETVREVYLGRGGDR
jgi:urea transport system ATP-binding protein